MIYEDEYYSVQELKDSDELCPMCNSIMKIYAGGNSPDDYDSGLICPECYCCEKD